MCARAADKHLSLAGVVQGNGIANYYSLTIPKIDRELVVSVCILGVVILRYVRKKSIMH